jgi:DNA-binding response OmpR family regulator
LAVVRVLVAISDPAERARIAALLSGAGHAVGLSGDAKDTLQCVSTEPYALLVLDDTFELVDAVRLRRPDCSILLVTAAGDVDARVLGLTQGADDALEAPFAGAQLVARVGALGRRAERTSRPPEVLTADGCALDLGAHLATRGTFKAQLTAREVGVLRWLYAHRERAVSRPELLEHVWGLSPLMETRTVSDQRRRDEGCGAV